MDFYIQKLNFPITTTTANATTTSTSTRRTNYFMKKKRKLYLHKVFDVSICQNSTEAAAHELDNSSAISCKASQMSDLTTYSNNNNSKKQAAAISAVVIPNHNDNDNDNDNDKDNSSICLLCRQHMNECCLRCCLHLTTTTTTSTENNRNNRNSFNNNHNNSRAVVNDNSCHWQAEKLATSTTGITTTAGGTDSGSEGGNSWHHSSCAASLSSTSVPITVTATAVCCRCSRRSTNYCRYISEATTFFRCTCSCQTLNSTTTPTTATGAPSAAATVQTDTSLLATAMERIESSTAESSSSSSPPTTTKPSTTTPSTTTTPSVRSATEPLSLQDSSLGSTDPDSQSRCAHSSSSSSSSSSCFTGTNDKNQITTKSAKKTCVLYRNALRTFQFIILYIQMQLMRPIFNKNNNNNHNNKFNNNDNNNNNNNNKRQQCPPLSRLIFRCNSYYNNGTTIIKASRKQPPPQQQQQQLQLPHHCHHPQHQHPPQPHRHRQHHRKQLQEHHFRYFKMPNLSRLYMILIVLSFLSVFLPQTQAQLSPASAATSESAATDTKSIASPSQVRLSRHETVCKSLDIRNSPSEFSQLENCTVIEGFLLITLVNTHTQSEFTDRFPLLTEVTEFITVYRVHNLRSLSQIFPNLSIIRGRSLLEGYALTVYSNPHLEDLGLSKLTTISRGGVRIENNLSLCFVDTIDWSQIVSNTTDIVLQSNRAAVECPQCPGDTKSGSQDGGSPDHDLTCKEYHGRRHCWNSRTCQRICPDRCRNNCLDEHTCCNEACLGGCSSANLNECTSCRHFSIYNNTCTDKCPLNYYSYLDRRCLTAESCGLIGTKFENNKQEKLVPYDGVCSTRCPDGYNKVDSTCQKCGDKCLKKCVGGLIDSVTRAKEFHGCTHIINDGLTISIKRGGRHLMEDLEFGLSSIEVIGTFLKVHRTFGMFSLEYFKNLRLIKGETLCEDKFALYVLENNDLETIWSPNQTVRIEDGRVFFHFNPKLCYSEIDALRPMLKHNATFDKNEVATDSNGYKGSCNTEFLNATVFKTFWRLAIIDIIEPLVFEDERTFIGYQYFYMEDKYRNATKHGHRPCDDSWTASEPTKETRFLLNNLEPFTQYAYYVKTMTISSEPRNAQSPIQYFKTKSAQPQYVPKLRAYANSYSEIIMNWLPPLYAYGNLTKYKVRAVLDRRNQKLESRNYCKDPLKEAAKIEGMVVSKPVTEKPPTVPDCKCHKDNMYDDENADASIHDGIDFENALQNFVYVKQTNESKATKSDDGNTTEMEKKRRRRRSDNEFDSFLIRHMRALPDEIESTSSTTTTIAPVDDATNSPINETRMDTSEKYYEIVVDAVNASTTEFVFSKLKHFSVYMLGVEACREPEEGATEKVCSDVVQTYVRTLKKENVDVIDNLQVILETTNTTRSNIRLRWDPPEDPNGVVVSYTISYLIAAQDAVEEKKCISELDYRNMTNGYVLSGLPTGNYTIRVRANSLAGEGVYSDPVHIYIPPTQISPTIIAIICISVVILLFLIAGVVYYLRKKILAPPSDLKIFPTVNPYYISLQYIPDDWEVPRERVLQLSPLGQGSFGMVYEGILKGYNNSNDDTPCAIKTVNENATDRERMNFLNEASVMKQFDTYHVVRLLGVCSRGQPALVVMELMKNGDLKSYLRLHRPDERDEVGGLGLMDGAVAPSQPPPLSRIYQMAIEIADGMAYLAAKKFVHRDLAARNCMVASDLTVKIGDFGMTRDIYETDYYRKGTKGLLPVRWMPPESLRDGVYSSSSDVFSYGVVLWEMATLASQPYQGFSNDQVLRYVIDGGVMERPENCPDILYRLMQKCWHHRPSARPTFMEIIRFLMDMADPHFRDVSFYHSEEGQQVRTKEIAENMQHSGDLFNDHDNDMDDVTTPLRVGEYNDYKLNMDNNSSVENHGDSPMITDDVHPHSPYSLGSAIIISSTPDGQSKNSYNQSQISHALQTLSSAPSTSAGIISGAHQRQPFTGRYQQHQGHGDEASPYVQPDYDTHHDFDDDIVAGKSVETDERGYEVYDPSPNYREHAPYDPADDEEDFDGIGSGRSGKVSGGQNLLPRQKGRQRVPTIMPMSSSMPDDVIGGVPASSLHPSTASAASSNASSTNTNTARKYPSLKRAVADTVQNVGHSLMPARLRNINRRFFNHKRSGSNTSHKSTSSNPNTSSSTNLTGSGRGKSMSGQNLGTIESGGSGSAGSYCANPRFFTTSSAATTSENPNYKLLDETANASCISTVAESVTPAKSTHSSKGGGGGGDNFTTSSNPNYQLLDETLNVTASPARVASISENPNYLPSPMMQSSDNPNYVMMNEPQDYVSASSGGLARVSENPNYQVMGPPQSTHVPTTTAAQTFSTLSAALRREQSRERFNNSSTSSAAASSSADEPDDDDDEHTEHIKMERMPLSRRRSSDRAPQKRSSRSRSQSQSKSGEDKSKSSTPTNTTTSAAATAAASQAKPSTTYSLKEKWLRQQQAQPPPPPPNGFIGREA